MSEAIRVVEQICRLFMLASLIVAADAVAEEPVQDPVAMKKTTIRGGSELPKYLYVVPWRDQAKASVPEKKLRLHNLYGNLFDPVRPAYGTNGTRTTDTR